MNNKEYRAEMYADNKDFRERAKLAAKKWRQKNPDYLKEYYLVNKDKFKKKEFVKKRLVRPHKIGNRYEELLKEAKKKGFANVAQYLTTEN